VITPSPSPHHHHSPLHPQPPQNPTTQTNKQTNKHTNTHTHTNTQPNDQAVACKHHGVAFYVAAPFTSFDLSLASGAQIVIEERPPQELTYVQGQQVAPEGIAVWNPGFDVTPAALITGGIITERGVIRPSVRVGGGEGQQEGQEEVFFDVAGFLQGEGAHRYVRERVVVAVWLEELAIHHHHHHHHRPHRPSARLTAPRLILS
jgi:hypothetical protein